MLVDCEKAQMHVYIVVSIIMTIILHYIAHRLPVLKYYKDVKMQVVKNNREVKGNVSGSIWRSTLWNIVGRIKWYGFSIFFLYLVTLAIFPGYITQDVHSQIHNMLIGFGSFDNAF